MPRLAKRLLIASGLAVGALLLATAAMEDTLGERAVAAVRAQLRTDLEVGGASISLWRAFPYVRVGMRDVRLGGHPTGDFLVADELTSRISWTDLLFGEGYTFSTVRVKGATITVHRDAERQGNWLVLRPRDSTAAPQEITFELSRVLLEDVRVDYRDDATATRGAFRIDDGDLAGRFASTQYTLTGELAGASDFLALGDMRYIEDFDAAADFSLDIDLDANRYSFGRSTATLDGMPVDLAGSFLLEPSSTVYDLQFSTDRGQLGALLRALPHQWVTPSIRALRSSGAFALEGTIVGRHDARHAPAIRFGGSLHDGALQIPALGREATDVSFRLSYTNGDDPGMRGSQLVLANLNAQLDGQPVNGNFAWTDFEDPFYDVEVSGTLPLAWLDELSEELDFRGRLTLRDAKLRGRHRYLVDPAQARRVRTSGVFRLERAEAVYRSVLRYFGDLPGGPPPKRDLPAEPPQTAQRRAEVRARVAVDALYLTYVMPGRTHPDFFALDLLTDVLAEGPSSRLYRRLLKARPLATTIDAYVTGTHDAGLVVVEAKPREGVALAELEEAILAELAALAAEPVPALELEKVRNKLEASLTFSELSVVNKAINLAFYEGIGDLDLINREVDVYAAVGPADLRRCAAEYLRPERACVLHYRAEEVDEARLPLPVAG